HLCCEEAIDAAAGAEVEHCFAGLKGSDGGGVAAAKRHVCDGCGEVIDATLGVHFGDAHDLDVTLNCCATAITASGCVTGGSATGIGGGAGYATARGHGQRFDAFEDGPDAVGVGPGNLGADVFGGASHWVPPEFIVNLGN